MKGMLVNEEHSVCDIRTGDFWCWLGMGERKFYMMTIVDQPVLLVKPTSLECEVNGVSARVAESE